MTVTERETVAALLDRLGKSCATAERCGTRPSLSPEEARRLIALVRAGDLLNVAVLDYEDRTGADWLAEEPIIRIALSDWDEASR